MSRDCQQVPAREVLEGVAFAGEALAPLFLHDPSLAAVQPSLEAFAHLDAAAAACEWPFVTREEAAEALTLMVQGLAAGADAALVGEYRRLFVGPGKKAAPPWGSVYLDRDQVIFGASTLQLRAWMRAHGVAQVADTTMPEDHLGYQLACAAWLARTKPELVGEYLSLHVLTWAPHFLGIVEEEARHGFYRGLALLTRATLEGMRAVLGLSVEEPRFYR